MQVPHKDRIACFAPCRRLSTALLSTLQTWYLRGKGGYNEVAVGTINAATNGTFGTASLVCVCVWWSSRVVYVFVYDCGWLEESWLQEALITRQTAHI